MDIATCIPPDLRIRPLSREPLPMTVEFERNDLDRRGGTLSEAVKKLGMVHDHPKTSRRPGHHLPAHLRAAQPLDEVEPRTQFVGAVHSRIERCKLAEGTRTYPQPAYGFPGVNGVGNTHYSG